jgi:hypothetical protein
MVPPSQILARPRRAPEAPLSGRRNRAALLSSLLLLICAGSVRSASLPLQIGFQGRLTDPATGAPLDGAYAVEFRLYDAPSGGTALYDETQTLTVTNGRFATRLGRDAYLSPDLFAGASAYLGVTVPPDAEMTPRQQLVMNAYAFTAAQLIRNGDVRVLAGTQYSTFTAAGDLEVPSSLIAADAALDQGLTASSGTFLAAGPAQFSLAPASGTILLSGTLRPAAASRGLDASGTGVVASTGLFTAAGSAQYSLTASSGVRVTAGTLRVEGSGGLVAAGRVRGGTFFGDGADLTDPRPDISSATLSDTLTVNAAETVILSTSITPSRTDSLVVVWVTLGLNRYSRLANWQLRVRRQIGGTCTTSSTQVGITNNETVPNYASFSSMMPILKVDAPATTSTIEYCVTAQPSRTETLDERTIVLTEASH